MNRIKFLREEKGIFQKDLAKILGVTTPVINYYENEKRAISTKTALLLADYFNVSLDYLLGKSNIRNPASSITEDINNISTKELDNYSIGTANSKIVSIPVVGKIAAGQPILAQENIEGYLPVDPNIYGLTSTEDLFYLLVAGQSMNMKVKNGDYALIHKQDYAEDGDIVVAIVNGDDEATLKRYKRLNDQFVLLEPMSTDPSIEAITVDLKNTKFQIIGKAIGQFGKF